MKGPARILLVAGFDSFIRSVCLVGRPFADAGAQVEFALLQTRSEQIARPQLDRLKVPFHGSVETLDSMCVPDVLSKYDLLIMAVDGSAWRRFFLRFEKMKGANRPLILGIYPGAVLRYHYDGFASRAPADFLWLNAQDDLTRYEEMCAAFGADSTNASVFGLPALLAPVHRAARPRKRIVFFEQTVIPRSRNDRAFLSDQLILLARRFPDYELVIKPRHGIDEFTLHRARVHIEATLAAAGQKLGGTPANLSISHEAVEILLADASLCLTVTSTVALEAVHAGVPTALISDFGAHDDTGIQFFYGSGLMRPFEEIDPENPPVVDVEWARKSLFDPRPNITRKVAEVLHAIEHHRENPRAQRSLAPLLHSRLRHETLIDSLSADEVGNRSYQNEPKGRIRQLLGRIRSRRMRK
ncbi:DUF6716 putative glycosyltransferase [Croceicoccus sediminis]|uniref:DUF6716 putative glycosyltransferase n=1 Tax=Croceicoccus sediminis TaxID=2571150 RepID=UPI001181FC1A|nr:DUF6716 putative glycosyltransferase [Croceicoccus sediminis]